LQVHATKVLTEICYN